MSKLAAAQAPAEEIEAAKAREAQAEGKAYRGGPPHILRPGLDVTRTPRLALDYAELEGPIFDPWPPAGHTRVFFAGEEADKTPAYAREILRRFMARAYRRPADEAEVDRVAKLVESGLSQGHGFEGAIRLGVQAVLASPSFLYLVEPASDAGRKARKLTDWELASRLSYFLWSTIPDDELFALAEAEKLREPAVLNAQVARMLKHARSGRFVANFAGQWLHVREFGTVQPAKDIYKDYDPELEAASKEEPLAFFREVLRDDLSVLNFLDSDFAVVNERLAEHYGIPGVKGSHFRRVDLKPEYHRGGVLTQAGLLTLLADGTRTLPVRRGAWILANILNDPPNPPPPNAGEIQPNTAGENLTVRDRLELHKRDATCASCHVKIDSYGYALENYDAVGAWRIQQNGEKGVDPKSSPPVDACGTLPGGRAFSGPEEFKKALLDRKERFAAALAEKLLMYALGRPVRTTDRETTAEIVAALMAEDYRIGALVRAVVASDAFRTK